MTERKRVLYFSAWYPHRYDAMAGLFVRKHAQAVARLCDVCVLYLHADENVNDFEIVEQKSGDVREVYVYYPFIDKGKLRQTTKLINYIRAFRKGYEFVEKCFGRPDITQANILTRSGILSWWLKKTRGIPYVIVEHWTRYLPENFTYKGMLRRIATETVVKGASSVMAVSSKLRDTMRANGLNNDDFGLINNVVDDYFYKAEKRRQDGTFKFLHVSCFDERHKNVCGILRAFKKVLDKRQDVTLTLVGTGEDWNMAVGYAKELGLTSEHVVFTGEKTPMEVCEYMSESDCFVMFSRYENAPVVISESISVGLPIISTNVGGIPQMVSSKAGLLIESEDEQELCNKMLWMMEHFMEYPYEEIRESAEAYSFKFIGSQLYKEYQKAIG